MHLLAFVHRKAWQCSIMNARLLGPSTWWGPQWLGIIWWFLCAHMYIHMHGVSNKGLPPISFGRTASGAHVVYISGVVWCIQCVFTLSSGFHASLFNKMAQGGFAASRRSFRQGRVLKKLGALSVTEGDEGYRILCTSSKKSATVTYFSELLPEFNFWGDGGIHVTWRSHGAHMGFICKEECGEILLVWRCEACD